MQCRAPTVRGRMQLGAVCRRIQPAGTQPGARQAIKIAEFHISRRTYRHSHHDSSESCTLHSRSSASPSWVLINASAALSCCKARRHRNGSLADIVRGYSITSSASAPNVRNCNLARLSDAQLAPTSKAGYLAIRIRCSAHHENLCLRLAVLLR